MNTLFGKELRYVNGNLMKKNTDNLLDQYFTKKELAESLFTKTQHIISQYEKKLNNYIWLEPSVGEGCFFDLLPENQRIGVDIEPLRNDIVQSDYLKYKLPDEKLIVIGNPPFGHRGVMALNFINHSQKAEYVCFILPMFFESKGKGSVKYRVKGFHLIHSEKIERIMSTEIKTKERKGKKAKEIKEYNNSLAAFMDTVKGWKIFGDDAIFNLGVRG